MKNFTLTRWILGAAVGGAAILLLAGCHEPTRYVHGEQFRPEDEPRAVNRFSEVQAAHGAGADATLQAAHFSGDGLNSLGQAKLDLMLKDEEACCPLTVYLDVASNEAARRQPGVLAYLRDRGMNESQVRFETGPNTHYSSPAANGLRAMHAAEGAGTPPATPTPDVSMSSGAPANH